MTVPLVSVLMVARNTAPFIDAAIRSVRAQTFTDIEILVVDDRSSDDTVQLAHAHARADDRVRVIPGSGEGLSAVRNVSLDAAQGRLAVIVDSDDALDLHHIEQLVEGQARDGAQICVTNMLEFEQNGNGIRAMRFAHGEAWQTARSIGPAEFARRAMIGTHEVSLGYLKPLFDLQFLRDHAIRYDERLRIGEDFDLVLRAMLAGARYHYLPQATYFYRKHSASTSYRLTSSDVSGLIEATRTYVAHDSHLADLLQARSNNLEGARRQVEALDALRSGNPFEAMRLVVPHRDARNLMLSSLRESMFKRLGTFGSLLLRGRSRRKKLERGDCEAAIYQTLHAAMSAR